MSNHLKLGGSAWKHYKYATWMRMAGVFTTTDFGDHFRLAPSAAWEILHIATDAGYLEAVGKAIRQGSPMQYQLTKDITHANRV